MKSSDSTYLLPDDCYTPSATTDSGFFTPNSSSQGFNEFVNSNKTSSKDSYLGFLWGMAASILFQTRKDLSIDARKQIGKIQGFSSLKENWDSYGALKPNQSAIQKSIQLVREIDQMGLPVYFVAPGPSGEILVELKLKSKTIEFHVYNQSEVEVLHFVGEDCVHEEEFIPSMLFEHLSWLR